MQRLIDYLSALFYASGIMFLVYMSYTLHLEHAQMTAVLSAILARLRS